MQIDRDISAGTRDESGTRLAAAGGILGALAMTSCCILPLAFFSLGATGAWIGRMGAMYQYRWYFLAFAALSLGYGFWKVYGPPARACDNDCARPLNRRVMKGALWSASAVTGVATVFPYLTPYFLGY